MTAAPTIPHDSVVIVRVDHERLFFADRELVAFDAILAETRSLVHSGCVPRCIRAELALIVCDLAALLHCGPHLRAHR